MEPGRQRAEAWLADLTRAQREADRNAQEPAQEGAGAEIAGQDSRGCQPEQIEAQEGSGAARACACACPAVSALARCEQVFEQYAKLHRSKRTPEGDAKAASNEHEAALCRSAIVSQWRPIETAPGLPVLVSRPNDSRYFYTPTTAYRDAIGVWRLFRSSPAECSGFRSLRPTGCPSPSRRR